MKEKLKQYQIEKGLSQNQLASKLSVSPATLSLYYQDKYNGDVSKLEESIKQLLARDSQKIAPQNSRFVPTKTAKYIFEVCALAHAENDCAIVIGEAGMGKTMALKEYANHNQGTILIEADPTYSPKILVKTLAEALGLTPQGSIHEIMDDIVQKLKGSERLIIIDEAELLTYKSLEIIRRIHDKSGVGLILAGMPRLRANLRGAKGEYKQLYSRIGMQLDLKTRLSNEALQKDLAMLVEDYLQSADLAPVFAEYSNNNPRRLSKLMRGAKRLASVNQTPINAEMIKRYDSLLIK